MIVAGALFVMTLLLRLWPELPLARFLHQQIVVRLVSWIEALDRRRIIFCILAIVIVACASELIAAAGSVDFAFIYAADLSVFLDVLAATAMLAASVRLRSGWMATRTRFSTIRAMIFARPRTAGRTRSPRPRRKVQPVNDDEDRCTMIGLLAA